jgi:hypothetical protein
MSPFLPDWLRAQRPCLENPNMVTHGLRLARALEKTRIPAKVMEPVWNKFEGQIDKRI